jgi:hypothetical protein
MLLRARLQPHRTSDAAVSSAPDAACSPPMAISVDHGVQCAPGVLMVRPARFGYNSQTAASNRFQRAEPQSVDIGARARDEFETMVQGIQAAGVAICVVDDNAEPPKPDAVFPNNWVSFHADGTVVLYPMQAPNRREERRMEILQAVEARLHFRRSRLVDLRGHEEQGRMLEGTGSLVLDHVHRIAYACRSPRTDESLVHKWSELMNYDPLLFDALGTDGTPIYHTNVLLSIGSRWAVVCADAIVEADRQRVLRRLADSGREIIEISTQAMSGFAANILELQGSNARSVLVLSDQARTSLKQLDNKAWERLNERVDQVVAAAIPTIETVGGGSARCMLAEVPET